MSLTRSFPFPLNLLFMFNANNYRAHHFLLPLPLFPPPPNPPHLWFPPTTIRRNMRMPLLLEDSLPRLTPIWMRRSSSGKRWLLLPSLALTEPPFRFGIYLLCRYLGLFPSLCLMLTTTGHIIFFYPLQFLLT